MKNTSETTGGNEITTFVVKLKLPWGVKAELAREFGISATYVGEILKGEALGYERAEELIKRAKELPAEIRAEKERKRAERIEMLKKIS